MPVHMAAQIKTCPAGRLSNSLAPCPRPVPELPACPPHHPPPPPPPPLTPPPHGHPCTSPSPPTASQRGAGKPPLVPLRVNNGTHKRKRQIQLQQEKAHKSCGREGGAIFRSLIELAFSFMGGWGGGLRKLNLYILEYKIKCGEAQLGLHGFAMGLTLIKVCWKTEKLFGLLGFQSPPAQNELERLRVILVCAPLEFM